MKHYTNKKTNEVYGYESIEDAEKYNEDFDNLVEMSDELFEEFKKQKPGHKWSLNGWVEDGALMQEYLEQEEQSKINALEKELDRLKIDLVFAQAMGDDISDIVARVKEVREELEKLK